MLHHVVAKDERGGPHGSMGEGRGGLLGPLDHIYGVAEGAGSGRREGTQRKKEGKKESDEITSVSGNAMRRRPRRERGR